MKNYFLYLFLAFLVLACHTEDAAESDYRKLNEGLKAIPINGCGEDDIFVVINMKGCSACYSKALNFIEQNYKQKGIHYFFTGVVSKKNLKIRMGNEIMSSDNVHIDEEDILLHKGLNYAYPLIFYRSKGNLLLREIADVQKGTFVFANLRKEIYTNN